MKLSTIAAALVAVTTFTRVAAADDKKFTLADLKALVSDKSYVEAGQHLGDISPSERKAEWLAIAGETAAGLVTAASPDQTLETMKALELQYPVIVKSPIYAAARAAAALPGFTACFNNGDIESCRLDALRFVDADPSNAKLTLAIAKLARLNMNSYSAVPFFKRAVAANKPAVVCKDPDLAMAVVAAFGLDFKDPLLVDARPIAANVCWAELRGPLLDALAHEDGGYYKQNICDFMRGKSIKETGDLSKLCDPRR